MIHGDPSETRSDVLVHSVPKTSDSSSLPSLNFSSVERNGSPSAPFQVSLTCDLSLYHTLKIGSVSSLSTLKFESSNEMDEEMNVDTIHSPPSFSSASGNSLAQGINKALDEEGFMSIKKDWKHWKNCAIQSDLWS